VLGRPPETFETGEEAVKHRSAWISGGASGLVLLACLPAYAQQGVEARVTALDEVVVTAQRRAQKISEIPVAVSALTSEDFSRRSASSLDDLQATVPSLRLVDIGAGSQRIQLRGISQYSGRATVGNYVDEVSIMNLSSAGVAEVQLVDLDRVEVLRGPQPSLYGENSMGGTIRYITADPKLDAFAGSVGAEYGVIAGGESGYRLEGMLNAPLSEGVAGLRLAAQQRDVGGWVDSPSGKDYNGRRITTVRGKLLAKPSDRLTVSLLGLYNDSKQDSVGFSLDGRKTAQRALTPSEQKYNLGALQVAYDFGPATLLSVTGYLDQDVDQVYDLGPFYNTLFGAPLFTQIATANGANYKRFSQELRLTSRSDQRLRYIVGVGYGDGKQSQLQTTTYLPSPFPAFGIFNDSTVSKATSETTVIFGNLEFDLGGRLTAEAGGRYFEETLKQSSTTTNLNAGGPGVNTSSTLGGKGKFDTFNPRVALTAKFDDAILYASAARGFRSGGTNTAPGSPNPTYGPESLWTYEVGTKASFLDKRLYMEAAVYFQDYKDVQSLNVTPLGRTAVFNSGKADGYGYDLSVALQATDDLRFTATYGHNDVTFTTTSVDKAKGDPLDLVPRQNGSLAVDWTPTLSSGLDLLVHVDMNYTDKGAIILRQIAALGFPPVTPTDSRTLLNARIGADIGDFEVYAYGTNLTNELKKVNPAFGGFPEPVFTQPRTLGLGLKFDF